MLTCSDLFWLGGAKIQLPVSGCGVDIGLFGLSPMLKKIMSTVLDLNPSLGFGKLNRNYRCSLVQKGKVSNGVLAWIVNGYEREQTVDGKEKEPSTNQPLIARSQTEAWATYILVGVLRRCSAYWQWPFLEMVWVSRGGILLYICRSKMTDPLNDVCPAAAPSAPGLSHQFIIHSPVELFCAILLCNWSPGYTGGRSAGLEHVRFSWL